MALGLVAILIFWDVPETTAESESPGTDPTIVFVEDFEIGDTSPWADSVPPVLIDIVSPTDGSATHDATPTVTLSYLSVDGTGIDSDSLLLRFGGILRYMACTFGETGADCTPFEPLDDGLWPITAEISDLAGRSSKQVGIELLVDTGSPSITLDGPLDGLLTNDPAVRFTGSVDEVVELFLDGDPVALDGDLRFDHPATLVEGSQVRRLTARDAAGNTDEIARALTLDTLAPDSILVAGLRVVEGDANMLDVTGDAGTAESGATVGITNLRTGETVQVVADAEGAFAASIAGRDGDQLRFDIADAVGNAGAAIELPSPFDVPPDPAEVATPLDPTVPTGFDDFLEFLWTGDDPIQVGVDLDALDRRRLAWVRGRVLDRDLVPVPGVVVEVLDEPVLGSTRTRIDGTFDLAIQGGGPVVLDIARSDFLPVQREIATTWGGSVQLDDIVLTTLDPIVTTITTGSVGAQVARGTEETDEAGTRTATLVFQPGTTAEMVFADGSRSPLATLDVRATEYTVGPTGEWAMPASLPPTVGYTYAVELSVDQAIEAEAERVDFSTPVALYVENFLGFPVGDVVPLGSYDRREGRWVGSPNGRVVEVLSIDGGIASLTVDGSGTAANASTLAALSITDAERTELAKLYPPGTKLWRAPIPHFTPWDCNWPFGPPRDAVAPPVLEDPYDDWDPEDFEEEEEDDAEKEPHPCEEDGSVLECENQILRKAMPIVGTPFRLAYTSDRAEAHDASFFVRVPLTGATVPASVEKVVVQMSGIHGFRAETLDPAPNLTLDLQVDKTDLWGREVQGRAELSIRRGFRYALEYQQPADFASSWSRLPAGPYAMSPPGRPNAKITLYREERKSFEPIAVRRVGAWDARRAFGMGGWSLDVHHAYDLSTRTLYLGDGRERSAHQLGTVLSEGVGAGGAAGNHLDGVGPLETSLRARAVAVDAEGRVYFNDSDYPRIRRIGINGLIETVAGDGTICGGGGAGRSLECGDGGPATDASLGAPMGMGFARDGSLIFADEALHCVRRVDPDGIITTVAGQCSAGGGGGGGEGGGIGRRKASAGGVPATSVVLDTPFDVAVQPDGSFYFSERLGDRVRYVGTDGTITTVVEVDGPTHLTLSPVGVLYVAAIVEPQILGIGTDGTITTVAGTGVAGFTDDGEAASGSPILTPTGLLAMPDGGLYFGEVVFNPFTFLHEGRIRWISPGGRLHTFAGGGAGGVPLVGGPASTAALGFVDGMVELPSGEMAFVDSQDRRIWLAGRPEKPEPGSEIQIAAQGGGLLYIFDVDGRHLRTVDTYTNVVLLRFGYDAAGRLITVEDRDGEVTTFHRDERGLVDSIESPHGQTTVLEIDEANDLVTLTNPADEAYAFTYDFGLLRTATDPLGHTKEYFYSGGRLMAVEDELDARTEFFRTSPKQTRHDQFRVSRRSAEGQAQQHFVEEFADGSRRRVKRQGVAGDHFDITSTRQRTQATSVSGPNETVLSAQPHPDPRFGMVASFPGSASVTFPSGQRLALSATRDATLDDPTDPLSLVSETETRTIDGRTYTATYDAASRRTTATTPEGRVSTVDLDAKGRWVASTQPGRAPMAVGYRPTGEMETLVEGSDETLRTTLFTYDGLHRVETITDPEGETVTFGYDAANRVTETTLANGEIVGFGLDAGGRLETLTPPGRPSHEFTYTPTDLLETSTWPDVGDGTAVESWTWDLDQRPDTYISADGELIDFEWDAVHPRLRQVVWPRGTTSYAYHPDTGMPTTITDPDGNGLTFAFDGGRLDTVTWSGDVAGSVSRTVDDSLRLASISVNGADPVAYGYDDDSLLTSAGDLTVVREPATGRIDTITVGDVVESWTYNTFGEPETITVEYDGTTIYAETRLYDRRGWITDLTRTQGGATTTTTYGYDARGRLETVTIDGVPESTYGYDANSNRTSYDGDFGTFIEDDVAVDGRDRLIAVDGTTFAYTESGRLVSRSSGGQTVTYDYDVFGNLRRVDLPAGTRIDYLIDPSNRRIGRQVDGTTTHGWLYQDGLNPVAELDAAGAVVSRFVYATRSNVPDVMIRGGTTYRIVTDHLGSPRLVVDTATGAVVQELRYDEFGRVVLDTNPGFQPFGFAGGLYDPATGLVRFGARDYDPSIGRWTTPDPVGFTGGLNLYSYAAQNPVAFVDPTGEVPWLLAAWGGAEIAMAIYDLFDTGRTLSDPCAAWLDKLLAGGGFAAGAIGPGPGGLYKGTAKAGRRALADASTPVGRRTKLGDTGPDAPQANKGGKHSPQHENTEYQPRQNALGEVGGREYTGHAFDQMRNRGLVPSVVEQAIQHGERLPGKSSVTTVYYDAENSVRVVVNQAGQVITVE